MKNCTSEIYDGLVVEYDELVGEFLGIAENYDGLIGDNSLVILHLVIEPINMLLLKGFSNLFEIFQVKNIFPLIE